MMNDEVKNKDLVGDEETRKALKLWVTLARCFNALAELDKRSIARFGVIPSEFGVMEMLYHKGPLPLTEIGKSLLLTSGSITYVMDKLEKQGFVKRVACEEDRRVLYGTLTEKGQEWVESAFPAHAEAIREAVSGLNPDEQEIAQTLLRKLGRAAQEKL